MNDTFSQVDADGNCLNCGAFGSHVQATNFSVTKCELPRKDSLGDAAAGNDAGSNRRESASVDGTNSLRNGGEDASASSKPTIATFEERNSASIERLRSIGDSLANEGDRAFVRECAYVLDALLKSDLEWQRQKNALRAKVSKAYEALHG